MHKYKHKHVKGSIGQFQFFYVRASEEEPKREGFTAISFVTEAFIFSVAPSLPSLFVIFSSRVYLIRLI